MNESAKTEVSSKLLNAGFRYVSIRKRSEKEILDFLKKKAVKIAGGITVLDDVLEKLRGYGYIDDSVFASWVIESRRSHNPHGTESIVRELKGKGVSPEDIEASLQKKSTETRTDKELAKQVLEKIIGRYQGLPPYEKKRKLFGVLGRRGFAFSVISSVVDDLV
ncbi:RecX family transcriptional regulator [Candidatus Gottesmanbacteria bacterium]|nr:RecX family transcriptional regulator [Candidatus Gottesmanbacteria bacterium]